MHRRAARKSARSAIRSPPLHAPPPAASPTLRARAPRGGTPKPPAISPIHRGSDENAHWPCEAAEEAAGEIVNQRPSFRYLRHGRRFLERETRAHKINRFTLTSLI